MAGQKEPTLAEIEQGLWNADVTPAKYANEEKYRAAVMDQYKLYVEMADRVSARRGVSNTFFLTLNSLVFTVIAVFWKDRPPTIAGEVFVLLLIVALAQCGAWWALIRSYQQLNAAKYRVVGLLEKRLPASTYSSAEWVALGEGRRFDLYLPLTNVERVVPIVFAAVYIAGFIVAVS